MILSGSWLLLAPLLPMLLALILMSWPAMRRAAMVFAPWSALPALVIALLPWPFANTTVPALFLGAQIGLDDSGRGFLLLSALVWWVAALHARKRFAQPSRLGFFILFLMTMTGNLGAIIANDVLSFYLCFALMSFAAYGLVIHERSPRALRAGRIYMVFVLLGEAFLLGALMLAASGAQGYDFESVRAALAQSDHRDWVVLLTTAGLGIKIGLLGLHFTLPLIYRAAPIPVAAVLAGAMINVALLGWLRLLPLGHVALMEWGVGLMVLGLFAAFYGVLVGLTQRDAKTVLAYSSISQMGILTIAVGLGLSTPQAWPQILMVITLYAIHHGLAKASLFLGLGLVQSCPDSRYWRRVVGIGLLLPALALAGAPLTSGMLVKVLLKADLALAPAPWADMLGWLLPFSALATTLLVSRFIYLAWPRPSGVGAHSDSFNGNLVSWYLLLGASLLVWLLPHPSAVDLLSWSWWWQSLWPVVAGVLMAVIIGRRVIKRKTQIVEIPAGDLLVILESMLVLLMRGLRWLSVEQLPRWQVELRGLGLNLIPRLNGYKSLARVERVLTRWSVAATLFLVLIVVLILMRDWRW